MRRAIIVTSLVGSVQTMIGAGKLNAEGSFHYLDDTKVDDL